MSRTLLYIVLHEIDFHFHPICAGHSEREKYGLPRLMEALESNMWSTMQRHTTGALNKQTAHPTAAAAASSGNSIAQIAQTSDNALEEAAANESQPDHSETAQTAQSVEQEQQKEERDLLEEGLLADSEENEIIDKFANFISEVQTRTAL